MEAGFIAVPLSVPLFGTHDERVSAALRDSSPAAILTTSAVVDDVVPCAHASSGQSAPAIIEIDALDLDSQPHSRPPGNVGIPRPRCCSTLRGPPASRPVW